MKRPVHRLALIAALCFISGIGSMVWAYRTLARWEQVPARVVSSELIPFKAGRKTRYRGELELRYLYKDIYYRVPFSVPNSFTDFDTARDNLMLYKMGATAPVYINPNDPLDFLVERKSGPRFFAIPAALILTGIILGSICVLLFLAMQRWLCPDCATSVPLHHRFCFACGRKLPRAKKWVRS